MYAIAAVDQNWGIGRDNALLFHIPADMKRFRALTLNGTVILGRKTLDTFPGGRPLPKRRNIVISHQTDLEIEGAELVGSLEEALKAAGDLEDDHLWVIGGGSVYTALLSRCRRVYLTKVDAAAPEADTFFPNLDKLPDWEVEHAGEPITENGITFSFIEYINRNL